LCKYIILRVSHGKGFRWMLYQWQAESERYELVSRMEQEPFFARLYHAQDKANWLERKNARAGAKPDHSSPIEAAAAAFAACLFKSSGKKSSP